MINHMIVNGWLQMNRPFLFILNVPFFLKEIWQYHNIMLLNIRSE